MESPAEERSLARIAEEDEEDDDIVPVKRRAQPATSLGDDLFGDEDDEEQDNPDLDTRQLASRPKKLLDDENIDSADDEDADRQRYDVEDNGDNDDDEEMQETEVNIVSGEIHRHGLPKAGDGELYMMRVPPFMTFDGEEFQPQTFTAPVPPLSRSGDDEDEGFNSYDSAINTVRWRKSPSDPTQLQSNARILRWSDGSLTLQMASQPTKHFNVPASKTAPPQLDPPKPTPTSLRSEDARTKNLSNRVNKYEADKDNFVYLASASSSAGVLRVVGKVTTSLGLQNTGSGNQAALLKLQRSLAKVNNRNSQSGSDGIAIVTVTQDPELAKRRAEEAEKERERQRRKRLAAEERARERQERVMDGGLDAGLSVGGLEDEGLQRLPPLSAKSRSKPKRRPNTRGEIYSDDEEEEDNRRGGRTREDSYDSEDGFVARSDEEEEPEEDDEDEDEGIDLNVVSTRTKRPSPAAAAAEEEEDNDDADGEPEDDAARAGTGPAKRRRIIDDDEDEDE